MCIKNKQPLYSHQTATKSHFEQIEGGKFKHKKAAFSDYLIEFIDILMVPEARLELARLERRGIL
ncbi:hypothetical protein ACE4RU_11905, partial [Actinobacillus seminis]|uniref:hypothetical protein n=1 Tax=Actinobacillus seminis TaxID=722 RepID=UPI003B95533A